MSTLLDKIKLPETLKELSTKQLEQIAAEIRQKIIEVTSRDRRPCRLQPGGGRTGRCPARRLSQPAGQTALGRRPPGLCAQNPDRPAGSVRHAAPGGRYLRFPQLRGESPHDIFTVGHASTSISQALGLVKARDLAGEKNNVIAVIGDGSLSGGLAFEGVNNVDGLGSNMIVILNDNEMSISRNVGAIANYLTQVSTSTLISTSATGSKNWSRRVPRVGISLFAGGQKAQGPDQTHRRQF